MTLSTHTTSEAQCSEAQCDEEFWLLANGMTGVSPNAPFDRYHWALRFGQCWRRRHGMDVDIESMLADLSEGWSRFGGPAELSFEEACQTLCDCWDFADGLFAEAIANRAGYCDPPTFLENGAVVPRNIDEANE